MSCHRPLPDVGKTLEIETDRANSAVFCYLETPAAEAWEMHCC